MVAIEILYAAADSAGLLKPALFGAQEVMVDFRAPDEDVLSGMGVSRDYSIRYPLVWLLDLVAGSTIAILGQTYRVREVTAIGDGSECRATLTQL
ncbi:MAG: hypothetical protein ACOYNZ_19460 [Rhodoferax sp.]